ncbi:MAG: ribosomal protein L13e [Ignisphaera sp.]
MTNENIVIIVIPPPTAKMPRITKYRGMATVFRVGRGYSIGEIKEAGLTPYLAKQLNIPIDPKRRSIHKNNVENLRNIVNQISDLINARKTKPAKLVVKQEVKGSGSEPKG